MVFISKFSKVYEILIVGLDEDSKTIPRTENKTGGLVQLFISKIPFEYGTRVVQLIEPKWDTIYTFIKEFRGVVDEHREDSEKARKLRRAFGGTAYESKSFDQKLQHLQEMRALQNDVEERDEDLDDAVAEEAEDLSQELEDALAAVEQRQHQRKALPGKHAPPREPLVCTTKILHGTCNKPGCTYVHREEQVAQKLLEMRALIDKQIAAAKPGLGQRPSGPQRAAAMEQPYTDTYDDEQY